MEKRESQARGTTLNRLKEELYSLNRRMLLALQNRDEAEQEAIRREIEAVREEIDLLGFGGSPRGRENQAHAPEGGEEEPP